MSTIINNVESGEQFIPASQRPDGTWRKARRIKDGYVPQEEVPLYESKGKQFMSKKQDPVLLSSGKIAQRTIPGLCIIQEEKQKKQSKKNKKIIEVTDNFVNMKITVNSNGNKCEEVHRITEATDPTKKLKSLRKRLREIESLEEKLKNGLVIKPEPEQLTKLKRKNDLLTQIREFETQLQSVS